MRFLPSIDEAGPGFGLVLLLVSMTTTQLGSAAAKFLFVQVGPTVAVALRLIVATALLFLALRPWRNVPKGAAWRSVAVYGFSIAVMNTFFYQAIARIPLGIAVTLEFSGPLFVAVISSRRWTDYAAVALAVLGLLLLFPWSGLAEGEGSLDVTGMLFALAAAFFWGVYIIFGRRAGGSAGSGAAAWGMLIGTAAVLPWALVETGGVLVPAQQMADVLPLALFVGFMASALPYGLEIVALRIVPPQVYGVLMSLEPAVAALLGFLILGEALSFSQWTAILLIIAASLLVTLTRTRN